MYKRLLNISKNRSFFLFGARATGKSTLLQDIFTLEEAFYIDLLDPELFAKLQAYPNKLNELIDIPVKENKFIIIDEVQKVPELLNIVHQRIFKDSAKFALSGSSARKLKRGLANMLAGRASIYNIYPLTFNELNNDFILEDILNWGSLPELISLQKKEKDSFLKSYVQTYITEEIVAEQIIRKLPPFRRFLNIAGQMNSKIINYSNIAQDINTAPSNIQNYFEILEDTLLGFKLDSFHSSIRKRQRQKPKFYWFDTGVVRTLSNELNIPLQASTSRYGDYFETFIINQIKSILEYQDKQFQLSYLKTKDGAEIDLIIERAGEKTLCIVIKSSQNIRKDQISSLISLSKDIPNSKAICLYKGTQKLFVYIKELKSY